MKGKHDHAATTAVTKGHRANPGSKLALSDLWVPKTIY